MPADEDEEPDAPASEGEADETLPPSRTAQAPAPRAQAGVPIMEGERVVFTEEASAQRYVKLVAAGEIDETLLDALTDYVKRQRKRLGLTPLPPPAFGQPRPSLLGDANTSEEKSED